MINHRRFSLPAYSELMANHVICLLTYVAGHPNDWQSYGILSEATGVPKSTLWNLINWNHDLSPARGVPLFIWAWNLGYEVEIVGKKGLLITVSLSTI